MSIKIMKIKRKKGLLLAEETLKIVIAVIAIGFLVYFLISLYFSAKATKELEQAEASLNFILGEAAAGRTTVDIYNPRNWWIMQWNRTEELFAERKPGYQIPESCSGLQPENCLCLCPDFRFGCYDGICADSNGFLVETPIKIENPPITLNINQESKIITKATNGT